MCFAPASLSRLLEALPGGQLPMARATRKYIPNIIVSWKPLIRKVKIGGTNRKFRAERRERRGE